MKKTLLLIACLIFGVTQAQDYSQIIASHLSSNRSQLGLQPQDIEGINIDSQSYSKSLSLQNVYVSQLINGVPVINSLSSFAIKDGAVRYAKVAFVENVNQKVTTTTPSVTANQAISRAASALGISGPSGLEMLETVSSNSFVFNNGTISQENIPVKLVYELNEDNVLKLAWDLSIYYLDGSHYYSVRVDATTGTIVSRNDWVVSCTFGERPHTHVNKETSLGASVLENTSAPAMSIDVAGGSSYRVFPVPVESPNHGTDVIVIDPADDVASPFGWHDTDGVAGAEFTTTRGNNVIARDDIDGNNTGGLSPDGGAALTFDFPYEFTTAPVNMLDAATTNLFYWNNVMHDVYYQYGFDESSGNFQENNYGNGGVATDFVDAQAQDGGGTNNANFLTTPDGVSGRMQMFLWDAPAGGEPLTINSGPATLLGDYSGVLGTFGGALPTGVPITSDLALVTDDNSGGVSVDANDACDTIINGGDLDGKIVVIRRGECEFGFKMLAAENEGAIAVIMVNNVPDPPIAMAPGDFGADVTIPGIMISQADGDAIIAALLNGDLVNGSLLNNGPPAIDGDLDNGIIAHEYGHGISNRLTGGASAAGCLQNDEQMGEGWSDWFGLMLTMQDTDTRNDINGIGTYATGQPTDGGGIREAPYSTDFSINNYTYEDVNGNVSVPHGVGFVWSTMLWQMTWDLVDEYGFDQDLYNGTGGNNIAMQLVIDGLKLQGCNPGFVDGRDAILEADMIANGGANQCLIWGAFAIRGLGVDASQGSTNSLSDGVEAFNEPTTSDCILANSDRGAINSNIIIFPNPSKGQVNIRAIQNGGVAVATVYDINGRLMLTQEIDLTNTAILNADSLATGVYILTIDGEDYTHTAKLIIE